MNAHVVAAASSVVGGGGGGTHPSRKGAVRPLGKAVADDTGLFHPLGMTFFWALHGWKFENARFLKNLDYGASLGMDFLRLLFQVDWVGNEIDPNWPDYDEVVSNTLDACISRGLKVEATMLGSPYPDAVGLSNRLSAIFASKPAGTIIDVEIWNEWSQNGGDIRLMQDCAGIFLAESGVPLVALSSDIDWNTDLRPATLVTAHTDRGQGDGNWRMVRQGYDAHAAPMAYSGNEPPGINSSLNVLESPLQLAMLRATSVQSGGALWVLHVGDMVQGQEDPAHGRHPNLWDVQVHDEITNTDYALADCFKAVRETDAWLPDGVENWQPKSAGNAGIAPQALVPDIPGWPDGGDGCNRFYSAFDSWDFNRFCQVLDGVKGTRTFTQVVPGGATYHITGINPMTRETLDVTLASGQSMQIAGRADGMTGYILNGVRV